MQPQHMRPEKESTCNRTYMAKYPVKAVEVSVPENEKMQPV